MPERALAGAAASPGQAVGAARVLDPPAAPPGALVPTAGREVEADRAQAALEAAAVELDALAARLAGLGRADDAEIVATNALMARDPGLAVAVRSAVLDHGRPAAAALAEVAAEQAAVLDAIGDDLLAARAADVRSVGRRAAAAVSGTGAGPAGAEGDVVLVAADLGPADVADLPGVVAVALAGGGVRAHAAIVARSLGLPMVVGAGEAVLGAAGTVLVDGDAGVVVLEPGPARLAVARQDTARRLTAAARARATRDRPAATADGRRIRVLVNAATVAEVQTGLDAGAEGAGLVRTELFFLDARAWPSEQQHHRALVPVLAALGERTATVRVLDFGGDKLPPLLAGRPERGIALLLAEPAALTAQLAALVRLGTEHDLRVLLPLVRGAGDVEAVRALLERAAAEQGAPVPALGAMIETPGAAADAAAIAARADLLSIGTNDLTASTLGADRFAAGSAATHDPRVLAQIATTAAAAAAAGVPLEVCGEAASDPRVVALLVGLGVDELSVGAARVGAVRAWLGVLRDEECRALAQAALAADDAVAVEALVAPVVARLASAETGEQLGEVVDGGDGVVTLGV